MLRLLSVNLWAHAQVLVYDVDTLEELGASNGLRCLVRRSNHRLSITHRLAKLRYNTMQALGFEM